ncbi:MAG: aminoglycoside phosphotransferase family protein [Nitrososphaerales archaeon]
MPELRPEIDPEAVLSLLSQHFKGPVIGLAPVEGGPIMRAFRFVAGRDEYLVRFNRDNMMTSNLPKEEYVSRKLAPTKVPVPPVVHTGRMGDLHLAISLRMPGQIAATMPAREVESLLPQVISTLDDIRQVDVSDTAGYGVFDYLGRGMSSSWRDFLELIEKEEDERDFFGKWHRLFEDTFLELDLYRRIYDRMSGLLECCSSDRYLVHGSYTLHNVLAARGRVTAVLNWFDARYGDFVYDVAGLDFWYPWLGVREAFRRHCEEQKVEVPHYRERLLCYECHVALSGLRFFAFAGNEPSYRTTRSLILKKLETPGP